MNQSLATHATGATKLQISMILIALMAGGLVTRVMPEVHPMAGYVQHTKVIPTDAVFKHAQLKKPNHDASRNLTGFDVDIRRLALLSRIS